MPYKMKIPTIISNMIIMKITSLVFIEPKISLVEIFLRKKCLILLKTLYFG